MRKRVLQLFSLLKAIGLVSSDLERCVADTGSDADDGEAATPYKTIARALQDAGELDPGQRLTVRITGTTPFVESLTVPSNVTLRGPATVRAATAGPALRITGTTGARVSGVKLQDLTVQGMAPYTGAGGAVLVEAADDVTLERCELHDSVAGRGGGMAVLGATAVRIQKCQLHDNTAGTPASSLSGADIGFSMTLPQGDGHGGGLYLRDSDVTVTGCDVSENQAILFGGGIAVSNDQRFAAHVDIVDCEVTRNQVSHDVSALLGVSKARRPDMGDPVRDAFVGTAPAPATPEQELSVVGLLHGMNFESGLGGGIAVRFASGATRISRCKVGVTRAGAEAANRARRGGGISCYIGGYPTIEDCEIANNLAGGDGGGISIDLFDPFLPPGTATANGVHAVTMLPRDVIALSRNHLHHNQATEDGGALYATGAAQVVLKGGIVESNRAGENGGGLRATYATNLYVEGATIRNNRANAYQGPAGEKEGGGGVAARNASVHLQNCDLSGNEAADFAGGAVYFVSCWEGGFGVLGLPLPVVNDRDRFDEIMENAFGFHTRVLRIVNCRGAGNRATGASGAGGFLYAVRSASLGGIEPMWVVLDGASTAIGANESDYNSADPAVLMRKRGNVVFELSGKTIAGAPADRVFIAPEIPAMGIAASTPTPSERAVMAMIDTTPGNDLSHPAWSGGGLVHGPALPTIAAVAPTLAATKGGTRLHVTGTGFEPGVTVRVGGVLATSVSSTATEVVVDTPALAAGPADVVVNAPWGPSVRLAAGVRVLPPPTIVSPVRPTGAEGAEVTLFGTPFVAGTVVDLVSGLTIAAATVSARPSEGELRFVVPQRPGPDPVVVRVTLPTGDSDFRPFTYTP